MELRVCVQINGCLRLFASEWGDAGIKPHTLHLLNQRKGYTEYVMERYRVPEDTNWTSSLMGTLAWMQIGIDYGCPRCRGILKPDRGRMCVRSHVCGLFLLSMLWSIRCHLHLLYLSLYKQSLIILLSALMDFWCFCLFSKFSLRREPPVEDTHATIWILYLCEV